MQLTNLDSHPGSISVVMPAFNEEALLEKSVCGLVQWLEESVGDFEILVVENGSTDRTSQVAAALADTFPAVRALTLLAADYGRALFHGILSARYDTIAIVNVDYWDLAFLSDAVKIVGTDRYPDRAPLVLASKRLVDAKDLRSSHRRWISSIFSTVLKLGFGLKASDTHGNKLLYRPALTDVLWSCRHGADLFDTELVLRTEAMGLAVAELPATVLECRPPRTSVSGRAVRTIIGLFRLRWTLMGWDMGDSISFVWPRPRRQDGELNPRRTETSACGPDADGT